MPRLLLILCLTQTGCMTALLWRTYHPIEETSDADFLEAALSLEPGPPRLLLRCAFTAGDSAVLALTPPAQEIEVRPGRPLVDGRPLVAGEPITLGGFELLLREDGRLEVGGAQWEWALPAQDDGTRASSLRHIWLIADIDETPTVLAELWYGDTGSRYVQLRGTESRFPRNPDWVREPFPLTATVADRGDHAALVVEGATRILDRPVRDRSLPNPAGIAPRIPCTPFAVALDIATAPLQLPVAILFTLYPIRIFVDSPRVPARDPVGE